MVGQEKEKKEEGVGEGMVEGEGEEKKRGNLEKIQVSWLGFAGGLQVLSNLKKKKK